ncbi:nuclear factor 7, brain-like [Heteronotia binoei]|uniref:nuclear factor 7, brain-like n=1 Tax=Heteronotia binoei TaxID=13085 RepID=UPI00292E8B38|nr:nuclear factor 7, brain-like [Heteronotia binoei]
MASATPFEDLTLDFACPICLEWFQEPVALPCGHLYCQACIETAWRTLGGEAVCPQCRKPFPERTYTPCWLLGTLIHRIRKMNPGEAEEGRCSEVVRAESVQQQNHARFSEVTKWYKEELSSAVSQLEANLDRLLMFKRESEERLQNHKAIVLSLGDHISTELRQLHRFLRGSEETWKAQLNEEGEALLRQAEGRLAALVESSQAAQELLLEAQSHLQLQDSAVFLKGIPSLLKRVKRQQSLPAFPDIQLQLQALEQFKGPIQYISWKKMRSALNIEFPHITLDPETAHPCLVLSDDCTCVRDGQLRRDVLDTPMRFNYCVAVLGCQGFSSGKHYWEVEVGNKPSWTLGLANISINRKGKIAASPANGYWVIQLKNGVELTAKDTPPQRLCPASFPKRVGVYLDYEGGLVSFYEAFNMTHLYSFVAPRFRGTLLPYFCPGLYNSGANATPLKICYLSAL